LSKTVLTIAAGKPLYINLAVNLARSFYWWHPGTEITFKIVTDRPDLIPEDIALKSKINIIQPGELGGGFSPKLQLDKLADEGQTLFIDSDCLIFGNLDFMFDRFKNHDVSVLGGYITKGEWFGDIGAICKQFGVPHLPKFNGGIYYLEKGPMATAVYTAARELEKRYDEIGFVRLRNRPNDEVLMALAMQLHGQTPVADDGTIMSDPQACQGGYKIDVIKGKRWLVNPPPPNPLHQDWYPFQQVSPVIVHFLAYYTEHFPYLREVYRLKKAVGNNNLNWINYLQALFTIEYPIRLRDAVKNTLRPVFKLLFGTRGVKKSARA
jgi:hypothetical protein